MRNKQEEIVFLMFLVIAKKKKMGQEFSGVREQRNLVRQYGLGDIYTKIDPTTETFILKIQNITP